MHHPTDIIAHTTALVISVVEHWLEREIAQCVHHEGSIRRPIAPLADALTTEIMTDDNTVPSVLTAPAQSEHVNVKRVGVQPLTSR